MVGGYPVTSPAMAGVVLVGDCSGVLVRPDRLLTSAHCLTPGLDHVMVAGHVLRFATCKAYPSYRPLKAAHDIAVCSLAEAAPVNGMGLDDGPALEIGQNVTLVGFGELGAFAHWSPELRAVDTAVVGVDAQTLEVGTQDRTACFGDSGGPVLVLRGGVLRVSGILHGPSGAVCVSPTRAVRIDASREWLARELGSSNEARPREAVAQLVVGLFGVMGVALAIWSLARHLMR